MTHCNWLTKQLSNTQNSIVINCVWLQIANFDYNFAVFISQFIFQCSGHSRLGEDRFYKSDSEFGSELGMSRQRIVRLKNKLLNHPIIGPCFSHEVHKINGSPTTHYHVDFNELSKVMKAHLTAQKSTNDAHSTEQKTTSKPERALINTGLSESAQGTARYRANDCSISDIHSYTDLNNRSKQEKTLAQKENCAGEGEGDLVSFEEEMFNELWAKWPKKRDRKRGLQAFLRVVKNIKHSDHDEQTAKRKQFGQMLYNDIQKRNASDQKGFSNMHFTTYLNGERWEDAYQDPINSLSGFED